MALPFPLLTTLLFLPFVGALVTAVAGRNPLVAKLIFLAFSIVPVALATLLLLGFLPLGTPLVTLDTNPAPPVGRFRAYEEYPWVPQVQVFYRLGVDELSVSLVFLATLLFPLAGAVHWDMQLGASRFFAMLLFLEGTVLGVFVSLDFILFFVFWELQLVPMYFLIALWGGPRRSYAALKFFLYTQAASLLVLLTIFVFFFNVGGLPSRDAFNMASFTQGNAFPVGVAQDLLFLAALVGFGTKLPMFPLHTWLLDAHVEAPTGGSVILAGILLKMGGYGIIRVNVQMIPQGAADLWWLVVAIGIVSTLYGAFISLAQDDLKRMVAASSISHMGLVLLAIGAAIYSMANAAPAPLAASSRAFAVAPAPGSLAMAGAIYEMFAHGLISPALFIVAGSFGHIAGHRNISRMGGVLRPMPRWGAFTMVAFLASLGLPGLAGFASEFLIFAGTYEALGLWVLLPIVVVVLTAAYYLYAFQRAVHGPYNESLGHLHDIHDYETGPLAILTVLIAFFGILPFLLVNLLISWSTSALGALGGRL